MAFKNLTLSVVNSIIAALLLVSCSDGFKGADARKIPANMKERQRQNIEEGRGFSFGKTFGNKARMNFGELH